MLQRKGGSCAEKRVYSFEEKAEEEDIIARGTESIQLCSTGKQLPAKPGFMPRGTGISQEELILPNFCSLGWVL